MLELSARASESPFLLARLPNYEAVDFSPGAGWILLVVVAAALSFFIAQRDRWRRIWCVAEDPRCIGLFRIFFGICCFFSVIELWPLFSYLFTDEGMWTTDVAQQIRATRQFAGYGDGIGAGELWGFYDIRAILRWLEGPNYSLLLFDSSPEFFRWHLRAFIVAMLCLIFGFQTRYTKWIAWFLFHSIIGRNSVYWEGTEHVYRCFFFYLALSRCGHAYSVDNWLRCRRLRTKGLLSKPGLPGEGAGAPPSTQHVQGLQAIYRRIPAWPRLLMMLQLAALYLETGIVKNGAVWARGDAFYYALNLDHFYRVPPQSLSALFGTNVFKLNTWVVHIWECAFPLVLLSLVLRWVKREQVAPLEPKDATIARISMITVLGAMATLVVYLLPPHLPPISIRGTMISPDWIRVVVILAILGGSYGLYMLVESLRSDPTTLRIGKQEFVLDWDWVLRWVLGRRVWLTLALIFHTHLVVLMNIGWFNLGVAAASVVYLNGEEVSVILAALRDRWARFISRNPDLPSRPPIPPEANDLPHLQRDDLRQIPTLLWAALGVAIIGVLLQWWSSPDFFTDLHGIYKGTAKIDLGEGFSMPGATVQFTGFAWAVIAGLCTAALRQQNGYAFGLPSAKIPVSLQQTGVIWGILGLLCGIAHSHELLHQRWFVLFSIALMLLATSKISANTNDSLAIPQIPRWWAPWAYRPFGRTLSACICVYHILAVGTWLLPNKNSLSTFRGPARDQVFKWLGPTQTTQSWHMFAPNPPRSNLFLKVVVTDPDGKAIDQQSDVYACFENPDDEELCETTYPQPWLLYSRQRKINRRIAGGTKDMDGWWQKWHARWFCKQWAYEHEGELPKKVELYKVWYPIQSPYETWKNGPYEPREQYLAHKEEQLVYTADCITEATAQPINEVRKRRGLPEVPPSAIKPWYKNRCRGWEKLRKERILKAEGSIGPKDPRLKICDSKKHREILKQRKERAQANK